MLTAERLRELLHYDPLTGVFTWRVEICCISGRVNVRAGDVAGSVSNGYRAISIAGVLYKAHRLAWLYVHGTWPPNEIDHTKGLKDDNRLDQIRLATRTQNNQNQHRVRHDNTSGTTGVYWLQRNRKWAAQINANNKRTFLGLFDSKEDAAEYRELATAMLHPFSEAAVRLPVAAMARGLSSRLAVDSNEGPAR